MRLLYLAHRVPYPPNKGDKIRAYHELRALADRGHTVHLAAFADDGDDGDLGPFLERFCASVTIVPLSPWRARTRALSALLGQKSLTVRYFDSGAMHSEVRSIIRRCDPHGAIVYSSTMAQYVPPSLRRRTVADIVDVDSAKWREYSHRSRFPLNVVFRIEARRLARFESQLVTQFAHVIVTTPREAALIQRREKPGTAKIEALVNGVDLTHFRPDAQPKHTDSCDIVFTGAMDYRANVEGILWFCKEVWPRLSNMPHVRLWIVGRRPTRRVRLCGRLPNVTVTGYVSDVLPYLHRATVVVVPLQTARGIQNKVLEAMACGRPVVVSSAVCECMTRLSDERAAIVATSATDFAGAISHIAADQAFARHVAERGRAYVERWHPWSGMLDRFCDIVESTAACATSEAVEVCA